MPAFAGITVGLCKAITKKSAGPKAGGSLGEEKLLPKREGGWLVVYARLRTRESRESASSMR